MLDNGIAMNQIDQSTRYLIVTILFLVISLLIDLLFVSQAFNRSIFPSQFHVNFPVADANVALAPTVRLNNGYEMPVIGLGTLAVSQLFNFLFIHNAEMQYCLCCDDRQRTPIVNRPSKMPLIRAIATSTLLSITPMKKKSETQFVLKLLKA